MHWKCLSFSQARLFVLYTDNDNFTLSLVVTRYFRYQITEVRELGNGLFQRFKGNVEWRTYGLKNTRKNEGSENQKDSQTAGYF